MKILTLTAITCLAFAVIVPASAQSAMKPAQGKGTMMRSHGSGMMDTMMHGLTAAEKKTAMAHMKKMTPAEKAVMMKRCSMCMRDPHKGMSATMKPTDAQKMQHMMAGLTKAEQATMMAMMKKMTLAEHKVAEKIVVNCCMYGMKHAGMKGQMMRSNMVKKGG
jgi:hypothetical protein